MSGRFENGRGGARGRDAPYWEIWNEPELGYAWDQSFEQPPGSLNAFFQMTTLTLAKLDAYRKASTNARVKALRFGMGSFAQAMTAANVIASIDTNPLPVGRQLPIDF